MYPYSSPTDVREQYQARVDAAVRSAQRLDTTRGTKGESPWTRLRAWLSARRATRVQGPQPVYLIS